MKQFHLLNVLYTLSIRLIKSDLLTCDFEAFVMKGTLDILDFIEMKGDSLFRYVPTKWLSLLPVIETMLKCWHVLNHMFKVGKRRMSFSNLEYIEDEN